MRVEPIAASAHGLVRVLRPINISTTNKMESTRSWIQHNCNMERVQPLLRKTGFGGTEQDLKVAIYIVGGLFALIYLVQSIRNRRASGNSWLKLRSRSPDPEKSDARKSAEKQTKAVRPFGSKFERLDRLDCSLMYERTCSMGVKRLQTTESISVPGLVCTPHQASSI